MSKYSEYFVIKKEPCPYCQNGWVPGEEPFSYWVCTKCGGVGEYKHEIPIEQAIEEIYLRQAKNNPNAPSFLRAAG